MKELQKSHEEAFGGDGYIHYLDCEDGFMGVSICQFVETCRCIYFKYIQFIVCQLYPNKAVLRKKADRGEEKCPRTYVYNTVLWFSKKRDAQYSQNTFPE